MGQSKALYAVGKAVCKPVFKLLYRYKTIIEEPLPLVGGMIIASNHISNSDPVLLGLPNLRSITYCIKYFCICT